MDRAWWAIARGVAKRQTQLSDLARMPAVMQSSAAGA